jgi:hypothetical protein
MLSDLEAVLIRSSESMKGGEGDPVGGIDKARKLEWWKVSVTLTSTVWEVRDTEAPIVCYISCFNEAYVCWHYYTDVCRACQVFVTDFM